MSPPQLPPNKYNIHGHCPATPTDSASSHTVMAKTRLPGARCWLEKILQIPECHHTAHVLLGCAQKRNIHTFS